MLTQKVNPGKEGIWKTETSTKKGEKGSIRRKAFKKRKNRTRSPGRSHHLTLKTKELRQDRERRTPKKATGELRKGGPKLCSYWRTGNDDSKYSLNIHMLCWAG